MNAPLTPTQVAEQTGMSVSRVYERMRTRVLDFVIPKAKGTVRNGAVIPLTAKNLAEIERMKQSKAERIAQKEWLREQFKGGKPHCLVEGCTEKYRWAGYCSKHNQKRLQEIWKSKRKQTA